VEGGHKRDSHKENQFPLSWVILNSLPEQTLAAMRPRVQTTSGRMIASCCFRKGRQV